MKHFRVIWEIDIYENDPISAAKEAQKFIRKPNVNWCYDVTEVTTGTKSKIDLQMIS